MPKLQKKKYLFYSILIPTAELKKVSYNIKLKIINEYLEMARLSLTDKLKELK